MMTLVDGVSVYVAPPVVPTTSASPPVSGSVTTVPDFTYSISVESLFPAVSLTPPVSSPSVVVPVAGPPGTDGAPGGTCYLYTQDTPAATWIINHNIGRLVQVTLFDTFNNVIYADIVQGTPDQATAIFAVPTEGSAVVL